MGLPQAEIRNVQARDAGLTRGIGTAALAASVVNAVVGAGIFTLSGAIAAGAGRAAPLAYLACAVTMVGVTTCFAEAGSRVPTSGGAYGTAEAAFGPACGFTIAVLLIVSDALASGGIAAALAGLAGSVVPALNGWVGHWLVVASLYACLAVTNLAGVRTTARLITGATLVKLLPLLLFLLLGLASIGAPPPVGHAPPPTGFGRAFILALFAFEGMETALGASGEVCEPNRTLPRALALAMGAVLALYVGVQLSAQHLLGPGLAASSAPLADAASRFGTVPRLILFGGAGVSMLAWMASDVLGTSRMVFALARDGGLPAFLGRVDPVRHVPRAAVMCYVAIGAVLAVSGSFAELVILSSLATIAVYIVVCLAALRLQRRQVALAGTPLNAKWLLPAAVAGLAGMAFLLVSARPAELAGLAASIVLSLGLFALRRRT